MPKRFICPLSTEELKKMYHGEDLTLEEVAERIGCKSAITVRKLFRERGIDTNRNQQRSLQTRKGMTHDDFKLYLIAEYETKEKSLNQIAENLNITQAALRRYFRKYGIPFRDANVARSMISGESHPRWRGGKAVHNGYIEVYDPNHPSARSRKYVYEHILVMEEHLGRYLEKGEVVHHINGNKQDNRLSNLQLMTITEHVKLHSELRRKRG